MRAFVCFVGEKVEMLLIVSFIHLVSWNFKELTVPPGLHMLAASKHPLEQSDHLQAVRALSESQGDLIYLPLALLICFRCQNLREDQESTTGTGGWSERRHLAHIDTWDPFINWIFIFIGVENTVGWTCCHWLQGGGECYLTTPSYCCLVFFKLKGKYCSHKFSPPCLWMENFCFQRHQGKEFS